MIMQAALSSVNFGSNPKPSFVKKSIDLFKSRTARLTNIFRGLLSAMVSSLVRFVRPYRFAAVPLKLRYGFNCLIDIPRVLLVRRDTVNGTRGGKNSK